MSEQQLAIPQPPDILFKNRGGYLLNEEQPIFMIEKIEAIEHKGIYVTYKDVPYARYGFPTPEAVYAINQVKRIITEAVKQAKNPFFILWLITTDKTKLCQSFNSVFEKIFGRHSLKEEFMCRSAFNVANFAHGVLKDMGVDNVVAKQTAFNLGQILEYDDAYRYRLQDTMSELSLENLQKSVRKEILRLRWIYRTRCMDRVWEKVYLLTDIVLLLVPFIKKSIIRHAAFLKQAELDENSRYWVCVRNDNHKYLGLTFNERKEIYKERPITYRSMA